MCEEEQKGNKNWDLNLYTFSSSQCEEEKNKTKWNKKNDFGVKEKMKFMFILSNTPDLLFSYKDENSRYA